MSEHGLVTIGGRTLRIPRIELLDLEPGVVKLAENVRRSMRHLIARGVLPNPPSRFAVEGVHLLAHRLLDAIGESIAGESDDDAATIVLTAFGMRQSPTRPANASPAETT